MSARARARQKMRRLISGMKHSRLRAIADGRVESDAQLVEAARWWLRRQEARNEAKANKIRRAIRATYVLDLSDRQEIVIQAKRDYPAVRAAMAEAGVQWDPTRLRSRVGHYAAPLAAAPAIEAALRKRGLDTHLVVLAAPQCFSAREVLAAKAVIA